MPDQLDHSVDHQRRSHQHAEAEDGVDLGGGQHRTAASTPNSSAAASTVSFSFVQRGQRGPSTWTNFFSEPSTSFPRTTKSPLQNLAGCDPPPDPVYSSDFLQLPRISIIRHGNRTEDKGLADHFFGSCRGLRAESTP